MVGGYEYVIFIIEFGGRGYFFILLFEILELRRLVIVGGVCCIVLKFNK